jgi:membrane fusion protein
LSFASASIVHDFLAFSLYFLMSQLFRKEVLITPADHQFGSLVLAQSLGSWMLVGGAIVSTLVIVLFLFFGQYTKRANAVGVLMPASGLLRIFSPASGIVTQRLVAEGEQVKQGQALFVISDERGLAAGQTLASVQAQSVATRMASVEAERLQTEQLLLKTQQAQSERVQRIQSERDQLERELALTQARVQSAQNTLERNQKLEAEQYLSSQALARSQDDVIDVKSRYAALRRSALSLQREQAEAQNELAQMPSKRAAQLANFEQRRSALSQESNEAQSKMQTVVVAPANGTITAILSEPGNAVNTQPLATLLPSNSKLQAHLFIPSRSVGFVQAGQEVRMRYQAYPYQKFGQYLGHVEQVSRAQISPDALPPGMPALATEGGLYRVTVKLQSQNISAYGKDQTLISGMVLEADVLQDKRRLIEWVFEPIYSMKARV